jgi:hypothetical protein
MMHHPRESRTYLVPKRLWSRLDSQAYIREFELELQGEKRRVAVKELVREAIVQYLDREVDLFPLPCPLKAVPRERS